MLDFVCNAHVSSTAELPGVRGVQGYLLGRPESGRVDPRQLEERHDFLSARRSDHPRPSGTVSVSVISGEADMVPEKAAR
jgi:hypothetical protein